MGYINQEEVKRFQELNRALEDIHKLKATLEAGTYRQKFELIMQAMARKLVACSMKLVEKEAEKVDFVWWGNTMYGLKREGLCEVFGRKTSKGNSKLRKTSFITTEYEQGQLHYRVNPRILEYLKSLRTCKAIKAQDRLEELIAFIELTNTINLQSMAVRKNYEFNVTLIQIPSRDNEKDMLDDGETFTRPIATLKLTLSARGHYSTLMTTNPELFKADYLDWEDFQRVSLPKTSALLLTCLKDFKEHVVKERTKHFTRVNEILETKGEYLVAAEL